MRRLKHKNIKRFKRLKPQAFQASSFKTDSVRQPCTVLVQGQRADSSAPPLVKTALFQNKAVNFALSYLYIPVTNLCLAL